MPRPDRPLLWVQSSEVGQRPLTPHLAAFSKSRVVAPLARASRRGRAPTLHTLQVTALGPEAEAVRERLLRLDSRAFTTLHILDRVPAIFASREQYAAWRSMVGRGLQVDPLNLVVVGSTCVGVSLSPKKEKFLKPCHAESDVDLAVVSPYHFDEAWRTLRSWGPVEKLRLRSRDEADLLAWHRKRLVFDGTIATERLLGHLHFGPQWGSVLGRAGSSEPTQNRDVKARLYRDFESLRAYHASNVESIKVQLIAAGIADDAPQAVAEVEEE